MGQAPQVQELFMLYGDQLVADSRVLAKRFYRPHKTVLRAYDNRKCSADFKRHNFVPRDYVDERGKCQRSVTMTRTASPCWRWVSPGRARWPSRRQAYIAVFNAMAEHRQKLWQEYRALPNAAACESKLWPGALFVEILRFHNNQDRSGWIVEAGNGRTYLLGTRWHT